MTPTVRTDAHDDTVDRLHLAIRGVLDPEYALLRGVRWAPHADFPNHEYLFDLVIVHGSPRFVTDVTGTPVLASATGVTTVLDVLDGDIEAEFYDKPDTLVFSSTCEYVLWDPSAELMRPNFVAASKREGSFKKVRSAVNGVFFSTSGFRLDVRGSDFSVSRCGRPLDEEDLFRCRLLHEKNPTPQLAAKIAWLEERVRLPRRRPEE